MARRIEHLLGLLAIEVLCGLAYGLCFPPNELRALAWVVLVPALVAIRRVSVLEAAALFAAMALVAGMATADWLPRGIALALDRSAAGAWGLFAVITLITVVPAYAAFAAFYRAVADRLTLSLPLAAAAAWAACEWLRASYLHSGHWGILGYSQAGLLPLLQITDVAGIFGVSFVIIAVNVGLAELWVRWRAQREWSADLAAVLIAPALVSIATLAYGAIALAFAPPTASPQAQRANGEESLVVAVVQSNLDNHPHGSNSERNLDVYLHLTAQALAQTKPQLIVWPEDVFRVPLDGDAQAQQAVAAVLTVDGAQLIAGGRHHATAMPERWYNSAYAVAANGRIMARYDKQRLAPFSEYSPLPSWPALQPPTLPTHVLAAGVPGPPLPAVGGSAGILIANEAAGPELAAQRVRRGARYLVNLADDTGGSDRKEALMSFQMALVRAIEQRRFVIRAAATGPSAIIDPYGRLVDFARIARREIVDGRIIPSDVLTPYARIGDAFAQACLGFALLALFASRFIAPALPTRFLRA